MPLGAPGTDPLISYGFFPLPFQGLMVSRESSSGFCGPSKPEEKEGAAFIFFPSLEQQSSGVDTDRSVPLQPGTTGQAHRCTPPPACC